MAEPTRAPGFFDRKSIEASVAEAERSGLRRALGPWDLTSIGIGAIIGSGIFFFLGSQAQSTGPAVIVSLVVSGVAAVLAAFSYAEFASMIPGSGSAYAYAYAAFGRLPAFFMGWLILNAYAVGNSAVAIAWSGLFSSGVSELGWQLPRGLTRDVLEGGVDVPAAAIMALVVLFTLPRVRESTRFNNVLVAVKVLIVLFVIAFGAFLVDPGNWTPFNPGGSSAILGSAAVLFFAYLGFDTVAATGEESRKPRRDLPLGILLSVGLAMVLYVAMAAVVTGMTAAQNMPQDPDENPPVPLGFKNQGYAWAATLITVGALVGLATVMYAFHLALARILYAMARDGFLPSFFDHLHPGTQTPWRLSMATGFLSVAGALFLPVDKVLDMTVLASMVVYVFVAGGVLLLQWRRPEAPRKFRAHWSVHAAAILLIVAIAYLGLEPEIHLYFLAWVGLGLAAYGFYAHEGSHALRRAAA